MDYLADSCTKLCQGREDRYVGWKGIPVDDSAGKECELVVVFQNGDLSVCKRMSCCRRTGVPDQVVSSRYRSKVICDLM